MRLRPPETAVAEIDQHLLDGSVTDGLEYIIKYPGDLATRFAGTDGSA